MTRWTGLMTVSAAIAVASSLLVASEIRGQAPANSGTPSPSSAEVQSRGQHKVRNIAFSDWQKLCFEMPDGKRLACRTTTSGTWESGQTVVRLDLIEGDGAARFQMFLPTGLYLQAGVTLAVDNTEPVQIPFSWCFPNGCVAAGAVKPDLIERMKSGQSLILSAVDSNVLTVNTSIPLARFSATHLGQPGQTFDKGLNPRGPM